MKETFSILSTWESWRAEGVVSVPPPVWTRCAISGAPFGYFPARATSLLILFLWVWWCLFSMCVPFSLSRTHTQAGSTPTNQHLICTMLTFLCIDHSFSLVAAARSLSLSLFSSSPGRSHAPFWWVDKGKDEFPEEMTCQSETENEPPQIASFVFGDLQVVCTRYLFRNPFLMSWNWSTENSRRVSENPHRKKEIEFISEIFVYFY